MESYLNMCYLGMPNLSKPNLVEEDTHFQEEIVGGAEADGVVGGGADVAKCI